MGIKSSLFFLLLVSFVLNSAAFSDESNLDFKVTFITDVKENIKNASNLLADWTDDLNKLNYNLLCLGETHNDEFRTFYGEVLKLIDFQSMALELRQKDFDELLADWKMQKPLYLLKASFDPIAQALESKANKIRIFAVEPTQEQNKFSLEHQIETGKREHSRDGFIAQNIAKNFSEGEKMVALYGSHHCSLNNQGVGSVPFSNHLKKHWGSDKVLNVKVLDRRSVSTHPLISSVDSISEFKRGTVVVSSQKLKPEMHNYNWKIMSLTENYDFIIIN